MGVEDEVRGTVDKGGRPGGWGTEGGCRDYSGVVNEDEGSDRD